MTLQKTKTRINKGRHVIISTATHSVLKMACVEADVEITKIADEHLHAFTLALTAAPTDEVVSMLKQMSKNYNARNPPVIRKTRVSTEPKVKTMGADAPAREPTESN